MLEFYELQQQANVSRSIYEGLLAQSKSIEAQKNVQVPDSRIVSTALLPLRPSFPKKTLFIGLAGVASLALGLGLAFLRENYVGGFIDEGQLESVLGLPVIAALPALSKTGEGPQSLQFAEELIKNPVSPYSEAIRRAKFAVQLALPRDAKPGDGHVVLITSALPNEGKTQTAISLARSLARAGSRTLLIDADMRRPTMQSVIRADVQKDIGDYVLPGPTSANIDDLIVRDTETDLSIIIGLRSPTGPTESLLESSSFGDMLRSLRQRFDYIILDSSPLLAVVDARLLLQHVDAAILVVRFASTPQRSTVRAARDLVRFSHDGVRLMTILNRVARQALEYGSDYGTYGDDVS
jgi:capsular exopolysaccharide synthesis family protein